MNQQLIEDLKIMRQKSLDLNAKRIQCKIDDNEFDLRYEEIINSKNIFTEVDKITPNCFKCLKINPIALAFFSDNDLDEIYKGSYEILKWACMMSLFHVSFDKRKKTFILFEKKELSKLGELREISRGEINYLTDNQKSKLIGKLFSISCFNRNRIRGISQKLRYEIYQRDNYTCQSCFGKGLRRGGEKILHLDHIIPINFGGSNEIENLQTLCMECNLKKSDRI